MSKGSVRGKRNTEDDLRINTFKRIIVGIFASFANLTVNLSIGLSIMKDHIHLLKKIKACVEEIDPQSKVILFGSRSRGEAREDSDWDILILTSGSIDLKVEQKFRHKLFELELEFGQAISTFVYSKEDWNGKQRVTPLYQNVQREGIAL